MNARCRTRIRRPTGPMSALVGAVASVIVVLAVVVGSTPGYAARAEDAGEAVVVKGQGSTASRDGGGSATEFSLRIPVGASCPGDTANDGYLVQSFMVPIAVTPDAIGYDGLGVAPAALGEYNAFRQPLYDIATRPFASVATDVATTPGQPGVILDIPTFSFAVFAPGDVPPGRYDIGIGCTLLNRPVKWWDTEVVVAVAAGDKPAGISWKLPNPPPASGGSHGAIGWVVVAVVVAALAVAGVLSRRRRPQPLAGASSSHPTEDR